jgi:hypothetical protein
MPELEATLVHFKNLKAILIDNTNVAVATAMENS